MDLQRFSDNFISMMEYKCLEGGGAVLCHIPYLFKNTSIVDTRNYAGLERGLVFMVKQPGDIGDKLWDGLCYRLGSGNARMMGYQQAVDLTVINALPDDLPNPPFNKSLRHDLPTGTQGIERLVIR